MYVNCILKIDPAQFFIILWWAFHGMKNSLVFKMYLAECIRLQSKPYYASDCITRLHLSQFNVFSPNWEKETLLRNYTDWNSVVVVAVVVTKVCGWIRTLAHVPTPIDVRDYQSDSLQTVLGCNILETDEGHLSKKQKSSLIIMPFKAFPRCTIIGLSHNRGIWSVVFTVVYSGICLNTYSVNKITWSSAFHLFFYCLPKYLSTSFQYTKG